MKYRLSKEEKDCILNKMDDYSISIHCWQGDDVAGFENQTGLSGGIQSTGSYPGKARTPDDLMLDLDKVLSLIPGIHRINLHAIYGVSDGFVDRDKLKPEHFEPWVRFAKERGLGIDFNPTFFAHEKAQTLTLSHVDEEIRRFWIDHGKACLKISDYFAKSLDTHCLMNIWIPDGFKDIPADRLGPRLRLKGSLDEILSEDYDKSLVKVAVESKVFGIGIESYTVGSHEFYMNYANEKGIMCLLDNGHYHPTEQVQDKISSMLAFNDELALHVTRSVRWDSDHVVLLDDETKAIAEEIVKTDKTVYIGMDFFDASINRITAWVIGVRNMQKALLMAMTMPHDEMKVLQDEDKFTELMVTREHGKLMPVAELWGSYCDRHETLRDAKLMAEIKDYERNILKKRG
ncbi:L-rhamnose isomerase [Acidaminobacter sp. JC074]|uniref:L-rhamnose isomerase n=1 Tax=Acidaminobacter sp. JC074 TaxID=2530199 RepID=UPI001F0E5F4B|nr:L-rhamnose isomerase [Acidaminobacter sp. JC074]MCH4887041.1 L-rhamnose isomerase [Acidaminobacter sp. JC074]